MLDTPSTESPHGKTLPARSVTFATSWHGSVGQIGAVDLRLALHRVLWVEPLKRTIIKVRMQWLSIDCLDGSCLKLLFGWLIVRHLPQAGLLSPFLCATNQGKSPDRGIDAWSVLHRLGECMLPSKCNRERKRETPLQQKSSATTGFC